MRARKPCPIASFVGVKRALQHVGDADMAGYRKETGGTTAIGFPSASFWSTRGSWPLPTSSACRRSSADRRATRNACPRGGRLPRGRRRIAMALVEQHGGLLKTSTASPPAGPPGSAPTRATATSPHRLCCRRRRRSSQAHERTGPEGASGAGPHRSRARDSAPACRGAARGRPEAPVAAEPEVQEPLEPLVVGLAGRGRRPRPHRRTTCSSEAHATPSRPARRGAPGTPHCGEATQVAADAARERLAVLQTDADAANGR